MAGQIESVAGHHALGRPGACDGRFTRTTLAAVWLRQSAAIITVGLGVESALCPGGRESRAGK